MEAIAVFLITLGLSQLSVVFGQYDGLSLTGRRRGLGYAVGAGLLLLGAILLPPHWAALLWVVPAEVLSLAGLMWAGSTIDPIPHPEALFTPDHPGHGTFVQVDIPDGDSQIPAVLLAPPSTVGANGAAVCIIPGAGDARTSFKWWLVEALLAEGFTVLLIDVPGHGDYRHRPLRFPDFLSVAPAAVGYLRRLPGIEKVGLIGISMGGAMAVRALVDGPVEPVDALVLVATATRIDYTRGLRRREMWRTCYGSPVMRLVRRMTVRQILDSWYRAGYVSHHTTSELFDLLRPLDYLGRLPSSLPLLLVYSRRDSVAPPSHAEAMRHAAPHAALLESKKASHVMVTLISEINQPLAAWLRQQLGRS
jgi:pimeloyl-ACP methyl ester carboxylesterase